MKIIDLRNCDIELIRAAGAILLLCLLLTGCDKKTDTVFSLAKMPQETADASASLPAAAQEAGSPEGIGTVRADPQEQDYAAGYVAEEQQPDYCWVHICGEVEEPGVYKMEPGSRICEVIAQAGGFTARAAENYVNQARMVEDGMKILIPSEEEVPEEADIVDDGAGISGIAQAASGDASGQVNINTATAQQLCTLNGIGASRAAGIIAYREEHGGFRAIEEIMNVEGIKEGAFSKIKDRICVR